MCACTWVKWGRFYPKSVSRSLTGRGMSSGSRHSCTQTIILVCGGQSGIAIKRLSHVKLLSCGSNSTSRRPFNFSSLLLAMAPTCDSTKLSLNFCEDLLCLPMPYIKSSPPALQSTTKIGANNEANWWSEDESRLRLIEYVRVFCCQEKFKGKIDGRFVTRQFFNAV